ncbi:MAG: hypothetical protein ROZ00_04170 [Denitratisoma sp.]|nr:hypothetical protein [Denitratisoma sp.]
MNSLYAYAEAKSVLLSILNREATLHESGRYSELGENYDEVDQRLPRNGGPEFAKLLLALDFWSGWLDSAEHDWFFYEPIHENDWPKLARAIVRDLEADREPNDPVLLKHFAPRPKGPSLLSRVRALFSGEN